MGVAKVQCYECPSYTSVDLVQVMLQPWISELLHERWIIETTGELEPANGEGPDAEVYGQCPSCAGRLGG